MNPPVKLPNPFAEIDRILDLRECANDDECDGATGVLWLIDRIWEDQENDRG